MDEKNKLDAYLENLGISDEDESAKPSLPASQTAPNLPSGMSPVSTRPLESVESSDQTSGQASGPSDESRMNRLVASSDAIIEDFLSGMLVYIDPGYTVSARTRNDTINAEILGGDPGKVIGREGRTLAAIEFLANTVIAKEHGHGLQGEYAHTTRPNWFLFRQSGSRTSSVRPDSTRLHWFAGSNPR